MKRKMYLLLVMIATATVFVSYGQNNNGTSSYWSDSYRQNQLYGKVKTVKTYSDEKPITDYTYSYNYLEFDQQGNVIKEGSIFPNQNNEFDGVIYTYDAQNRVTKADDGYGDILVFGYDGSHNVYMPTNYFGMFFNSTIANMRMTKGLSSFQYYEQNDYGEKDVDFDAQCASVSSNHLTFNATTSDFFAIFVDTIVKVEVDCAGSYPTRIGFMTSDKASIQMDITYGADEMWDKITMSGNYFGESKPTFEFINIAGFMVPSKRYDPAYDPADTTAYAISAEWQYNDKGYPIQADMQINQEEVGTISYEYEYDSTGNWNKQTEIDVAADGSGSRVANYTREYTYYDTPPTNIPVLQAETNAYLIDKTLNIQSPNAETVKVYSMSGALLYSFQKQAGLASYPVNPSKGTVLIMKGSAGWVRKVIVN